MTLQRFLINECSFLSLGIGIAIVFSTFRNGPPGIGQFAFAFVFAILFCLLRAGISKPPYPDLPLVRSVASQVLLAIALLALLIFEFLVALNRNLMKAPPEVWLALALTGGLFLTFSATAHVLSGHVQLSSEENESAENLGDT